MTFPRRSNSLGLTRAFSSLLSSKHFSNYNAMHTELPMEYLARKISAKGALVLPLNERSSVQGPIPSHRRSLERRHFKHPLVSIAPLISNHLPFHHFDEVCLSDPPPAGTVSVYGNHLATIHFACIESPEVNHSMSTSLKQLEGDDSAQTASSQGAPIFAVHGSSSTRSKTFIPGAKLPLPSSTAPASKKRTPDDCLSPRSKVSSCSRQNGTSGSANAEGVDGIIAGSATCLLASRRNSKPTVCTVDPAVLVKAKSVADEAIKKNKIFAVLGPYRHIREGMRRRGWVEKFYRAPLFTIDERVLVLLSPSSQTAENEASTKECTDEDVDTVPEEKISTTVSGRRPLPWEEKNGFYGLLGRNVRNAAPNFIWSLKKANIDFRILRPNQLVNHHIKAPFTTKIGLCRQLRHYSQHSEKNEDYIFPRCFIVSLEEERTRFIGEFRLTAAMCMLKWACNYYSTPPRFMSAKLDSNIPVRPAGNKAKVANGREGITPTTAVAMALLVCEHFLHTKRRDGSEVPSLGFTDSQWESFLTCFYATHGRSSPFTKEEEITRQSRRLCDSLKTYCPQFELDGQRNIWIVKPGSKSRGRGITCHSNIETILTVAPSGGSVDNRFVVQKYIERPLLVYNTKFDIRQWFLISDWQPLTIWWYKECYLRFCSREFTLDSLGVDVHLSNNAVSQKFKNGERSPLLPTENMWYMDEFRHYLENLGHRHVLERRILPEMQKEIINSMLCSQDAIDPRKGSFELYGADFMISADDLRPWLIEINASPCMAPTTAVTSDLTARVLEDTLKVVVDRRTRRNCDVGGYILLYRQKSVLSGNSQRESVSRTASLDNSLRRRPSKSAVRGPATTLPSIARSTSLDTRGPHSSNAATTVASFISDNTAAKTHSTTASKTLVPTTNREAAGDDRGHRRPLTQGEGEELSEIHGLSVSGRSTHPRDTNATLGTRRTSAKRVPLSSGKYATTVTLTTVGSRSRPKEREVVLHRMAESEKPFKSPVLRQPGAPRIRRAATVSGGK
ncbi:protein monoglycylase ttll8 [Echinococcus multilocularis]|uniref:Protein monoglycylase ttll8 n=1 Tax=Echinococcus multilocularis TaxID=6211 RepID=A0A068YCA6_ECHMU|nr:protein monoglycylase ttll8 [Echinococcus multilocularis]